MTESQPSVEYYHALGLFISTFSEVEAWMQVLLMETAKTSWETGRALFSGVRVQEASKLIRRVHEAKGIEIDKDMTDTLAKVGEITTLRNDILHYGTTLTAAGDLFVSNARIAHIKEKVKETQISEEILNQLTEDLATLTQRLYYFACKAADFDLPPKESDPETWRRPWRYKPSSRSQPQNKSPKGNHSQPE